MKTLCLYYTRTNTTKAVMENIAGILGADLAEYTDGRERSGVCSLTEISSHEGSVRLSGRSFPIIWVRKIRIQVQ